MGNIKTHAVFIALLFVLSLIFLSGIFKPNSVLDNVHYTNDLAFVSYNTKEALKSDELPLWTPYFYSGHPLIAIPENYMFDLNFLFVYLFGNIYLAMNLALLGYFFAAGLGMYLLAYSFTDDRKAAFISALIYMFNGFMHSFIISGHINILEGYALIPFIFLFVHKALKSKEWIFYSVLAGLLFALQILSGSMIFFFYTALLAAMYVAFNLAGKKFAKVLVKSVFVGIIIAVAALSLAAIKLLPVLEFTKMSSRAASVSFNEFLGYPVNFGDFIGVVATNIGYSGFSAAVGIIGSLLLLYSLFEYKKKIVAFSLIAIVFSLLFASGTFVAGAMYKVPGFDKLRHVERALVLFAFAASVLCAYGFASLSEKLKRYSAYVKYVNLFFALIVFLVLSELLFLHFPKFTKVTTLDEIKVLDYMGSDKSVFRTINLAQKEVVGSAGYNYYAQKGISEAKGGGGIWINDYVIFVGLAQQSLNSKMLGVLNVKYIVADAKIEAGNLAFVNKFNECKECAVWNAFGPYLYENKGFLPRYYSVPNSILIVGDDSMAKQLVYGMMFQSWKPENAVLVQGTKIDDYDVSVLKKFDYIFLLKDSISQSSIGKINEYVSQGGKTVPDILNGKNSISNEDVDKIFNSTKGTYKDIKASHYSNNKAVVELNGEKGWLAVSERFAHFPGWKASINGNNVNMFKANNAVTAVYLEGEKGELVFEYKPESYKKGKLITIGALALIIGYLGYFVYARKFRHGDKN